MLQLHQLSALPLLPRILAQSVQQQDSSYRGFVSCVFLHIFVDVVIRIHVSRILMVLTSSSKNVFSVLTTLRSNRQGGGNQTIPSFLVPRFGSAWSESWNALVVSVLHPCVSSLLRLRQGPLQGLAARSCCTRPSPSKQLPWPATCWLTTNERWHSVNHRAGSMG